MATASVVKVHPTQQPVYAVPHLSQASADETNKLLQENHSKHHIFFEHKIGFHVCLYCSNLTILSKEKSITTTRNEKLVHVKPL